MFKSMLVAAFVSLLFGVAMAQQALPLTDWRAAVDSDLSKLSMPRDAHQQVFNMMQLYERQAQTEKLRQQIHPIEPPKE